MLIWKEKPASQLGQIKKNPTLFLRVLWGSRKLASFFIFTFFLECTASSDVPLILTTKPYLTFEIYSRPWNRFYVVCTVNSRSSDFMSQTEQIMRLNKRKEKIKSSLCPISWYFELPQPAHMLLIRPELALCLSLFVSLVLVYVHAHTHTHTGYWT